MQLRLPRLQCGPELKSTSDRTGEATTDEWGTVIGVAADLGCRFATVAGGEPFVRHDALSILGALHDAGITIEVDTNASLITPTVAAALARLRIYRVEVCLYGSGHAHTYSTALLGIRALRDSGVPFSVKYFATGSSYERFTEAREDLQALGIEPRLVGPFVPGYASMDALAIEPDGSVRAGPKLGIHVGNVFVDGLEAVWSRSAGLKRFRAFWPTVARERGYVGGAQQPDGLTVYSGP